MSKETVGTTEQPDHSRILNETVNARIKAIAKHRIMDGTSHLDAYFKAVNLEDLSDNDKKVLAELIPYASGLMIPFEMEESLVSKSLFDSINKAEFEAGSNLLIPEDGQVPTDECIKDAIANFRAFVVTLETMGIWDIKERTTEKLTNALARMFVDIGYPLPPEISEKITLEEYSTLKLMAKMHNQGSMKTNREFKTDNQKIQSGKNVELPLTVRLCTADSIQKILDIYAEVDVEEHQRKIEKVEAERRELAQLYMEFVGRFPNLEALTGFLLDKNGKASPINDSK